MAVKRRSTVYNNITSEETTKQINPDNLFTSIAPTAPMIIPAATPEINITGR